MGDKQKTHRICEICGVRERHKSEKIFFARFPMKVDRCKEWLRATGNQDLVHLPIEKLHDLRHICGKHFTKKDFNKNGTRLKKRAIPNLYVTATPLTEDHFAEFPQCIANDPGVPSSSKQQVSPSISIQPTKNCEAIKRKSEKESTNLEIPCKSNIPVTTPTKEVKQRKITVVMMPICSQRTQSNCEESHIPESPLTKQTLSIESEAATEATDTMDGWMNDGVESCSANIPLRKYERKKHNKNKTTVKKEDIVKLTLPVDVKLLKKYKRKKLNESKTTPENENIVEVNDDSNHSEPEKPTFSWQQSNAVVPCVEDAEFTTAEETEMFPKQSTHTEAQLEYEHEGVVCDICSNKIVGFRYVCVQCPDVDLCNTCERNGAHQSHYILRVPPRRPPSELLETLRRIRALLNDAIVHLPAENMPSTLHIPIEIKTEESDPMDVEPPVVTASSQTETNTYFEETTLTDTEDSSTDDEGSTPEKKPSEKVEDEEMVLDKDSSTDDEGCTPEKKPPEKVEDEEIVLDKSEDSSPDPSVWQASLPTTPISSSISLPTQTLPQLTPKKIVVKKLEPNLPNPIRYAYNSPGIDHRAQKTRIVDLAKLPQHLREKFVLLVDKKPKLSLKEARVRVKRLSSLEIDAALTNS